VAILKDGIGCLPVFAGLLDASGRHAHSQQRCAWCARL